MYKFNELPWMNKRMRNREFPFHGKAKVHLQNGDVIKFNSGDTEMMQVCFKLGTRTFWNWGPKTHGVLRDADGNTYDFNNMFITKDGKEPRKGGRIGGTSWGVNYRQPLEMDKTMTLTVYRTRGKVKMVYTGARLT